MARINEYEAKGGTYRDPAEAVSTLERLIANIEKAKYAGVGGTEKKRKFLSHVAGLKDCSWLAIEAQREAWIEAQLDASFYEVSEEIKDALYMYFFEFRHPVYEHVWLTDRDGKDLSDYLVPFLTVVMRYSKDKGQVTVQYEESDQKLNLPEVKTSFKGAREDLQLLKAEVEGVKAVKEAACATRDALFESVEQYCRKSLLKFEGIDVTASTVDDDAEEAGGGNGSQTVGKVDLVKGTVPVTASGPRLEEVDDGWGGGSQV